MPEQPASYAPGAADQPNAAGFARQGEEQSLSKQASSQLADAEVQAALQQALAPGSALTNSADRPTTQAGTHQDASEMQQPTEPVDLSANQQQASSDCPMSRGSDAGMAQVNTQEGCSSNGA